MDAERQLRPMMVQMRQPGQLMKMQKQLPLLAQVHF